MLEYKLILVDAPGLVHAMYHYNAFNCDTTLLSNLAGLKESFPGAVIVVLFDHPNAKSVRRKLFPGYKNRPHKEGVGEILDICRNAVTASGYICWQDPGYEADDLIASLAKKFDGTCPVLIYGKDKDHHAHLTDTTHQLITSIKVVTVMGDSTMSPQDVGVNILAADGLTKLNNELAEHAADMAEAAYVETTTPKDKLVFVTPEKVFESWGVWPRQWTEFRAMWGDASDNIPGVKGIGEKTAMTVLQACQSLAMAQTTIDSVGLAPSRLRAMKEAFADGSIWKYKDLCTAIMYDPLPEAIETAIVSGLRGEKVDTSQTQEMLNLNSELDKEQESMSSINTMSVDDLDDLDDLDDALPAIDPLPEVVGNEIGKLDLDLNFDDE